MDMSTKNSPGVNEEKVKRFHQFIHLERGPANTAVIDLLKGNVFQVENHVVDKFNGGSYSEIREFLEAAVEEGLVIEVRPRTWIPEDQPTAETAADGDAECNLELHVEEGVNLGAVLKKLAGRPLYRVVLYGRNLPENLDCPVAIVKKEKRFQSCISACTVDGDFNRITHTSYRFNQKYNSCWGAKIAITADGKIRPCIYSDVCVGHLDSGFPDDAIAKLKEYWFITKDRVDTCSVCELRHICFDCREIARRQTGNLLAANPHCSYDPHKGTW